MKFSRLLAITALASLAIAGCKKPQEDFGPANLEVSTTSLSFDTSEAIQSVDVTATRDWEVVISDDAKAWLSAEPVSGWNLLPGDHRVRHVAQLQGGASASVRQA